MRFKALSWADADFWAKIDIPPGLATDEKAFIAEIPFTYLAEIDYTVVREGQVREHRERGLRRPLPADYLPGTYHPFPFEHDNRTGETVLIHLRTHGVVEILPSLTTAPELSVYLAWRLILCGAVAGGLLIIIVYLLFIFLVGKEIAYLNFAGIIMCFLVAMPFYFATGLEHYFSFKDQFLGVTRLSLACLSIAFTCAPVFGSALYAWKHNERGVHRFSQIVAAYFFALTLIMPFVPLLICNSLIILGSAVATILYLLIAVKLLAHEDTFMMLVGLVGIAVSGGLHIAFQFGFVPGSTWPLPTFWISGVWFGTWVAFGFAQHVRVMQRQKQAIIDSLRLDLPGGKINELLSQSYSKQYKTGKMHLTVMFIDIVGFSRVTERLDASAVFEKLAKRLKHIGAIVHDHKGSVDRSLGDGILCFFGYAGSAGWKHHASAAFAAARKIQEEILEEAVAAQDENDIFFPVRIGLNSCEVTIGNLGGEGRVDFTMIGGGVNFASRLEAACAPFKIILSEESKQKIERYQKEAYRFDEILVAIKHHDKLAVAYEFDPFTNREQDLRLAEARYMTLLGLNRTDRRIEITAETAIHLRSDIGSFRVLDFSRHGFRTVSDTYIGQHATLFAAIEVPSAEVTALLKAKLLNLVKVEVRWSRRTADGYMHGLKLDGLSEAQLDLLFSVLESGCGPATTLMIDPLRRLGTV